MKSRCSRSWDWFSMFSVSLLVIMYEYLRWSNENVNWITKKRRMKLNKLLEIFPIQCSMLIPPRRELTWLAQTRSWSQAKYSPSSSFPLTLYIFRRSFDINKHFIECENVNKILCETISDDFVMFELNNFICQCQMINTMRHDVWFWKYVCNLTIRVFL